MDDPNSVVITESTAKKYFGDQNPVGKVLNYENSISLIVTGVIKDIPENSHFTFEILGSLKKVNIIRNFNYDMYWGANPFRTYILLNEKALPEDLEKKTNEVYSIRYYQHYNKKYSGSLFTLQPLSEVYLHPKPMGETGKTGNIETLMIFLAVAVVIITVACINFTNLTVSLSLNRIKEIGIRRVTGAQKRQLMSQFIYESIIIAFISLIAACLLSKLIAPIFSELIQEPIELNFFDNFNNLILLVFLTFFIGILSGCYPGLFISSFRTVDILRKKPLKASKRISFKNILVTTQFIVTACVVCGIIIISSQMNFIKRMDLGFNDEQIITMRLNSEVKKIKSTLRNELMNIQDVKYVTGLYSLFSESNENTGVHWEGLTDEDDEMMRWIAVDFDFVKAFEIEFIAGRDFSKEFQADVKRAYILTESAVKHIGWSDPIGKEFNIKDYADIGPGKVIGVIKDFHYRSLHSKIEPFYLVLWPEECNILAVKISAENIQNTIARIKTVWKRVLPNIPFEFSFFSEEFNTMYKKELLISRIFKYFALITIFISFLGLFGLTSFLVEKKIKEIGIRKVLGSSVFKILLLFYKEFFKYLIIANIAAIPVIYYFMLKWLENFAYRITVSPVFFVLTALSTFAIAIIAISVRTVKAALSNPVDSLRYE